jgi:hypothetical protein
MKNSVFWGVAGSCSRWFFARGFFYPEDGGGTILRNVGSIDHIYTAPHPRRRHSSKLKEFKIKARTYKNIDRMSIHPEALSYNLEFLPTFPTTDE